MKKQYRVLYSFETIETAENFLTNHKNIGKIDIFIEEEQAYYYSVSPYTEIIKADNEIGSEVNHVIETIEDENYVTIIQQGE